MTDPSTATTPQARELFEDEHEAFRESFRRFLEGETVPAYPEWRREGVPRELFRELAAHQFVAASVPEEHGGAGIDDFRFGAVICEEAMRANATGLALMLAALNEVCVPLLAELADDDGRARWLPGLAGGEIVAALAPPERPLRATRSDGHLIVEGAAEGLINGGLAEVLIVPLQLADEEPMLAVLEASSPGIERTRSAELIGPRPCDRGDIRLEGVDVPMSAVLADGVAAALERAERAERLSVAVMCIAGSRRALSETLAYVHDRRAFGRPIAEFENTRFALAGLEAEIEATEAFVDSCVREHLAARLTASRCAAAKLRASELLQRTVDWGVQLHGGYGYMLEYPIAHSFMDARFLTLHAGSSERMKEIVAGSIGL